VATDLLTELQEEARHCKKWARRNYNFAHAVFLSSVLLSFMSSIVVSLDDVVWDALGWNHVLGRILLTVTTAAPAALLLVNNTLRFEERSKWFWKKTRVVQRLHRQLRDDPTADKASISRELGEVSETLEDQWPAFGATPSQPQKPGT
jgi:hypothetical protein